MPDCKNVSTQGRIERPSSASARSINYPLSNRFEKMSLAFSAKCCKTPCMGLETLARRSDGVPIENPRYYQKAQAKLRRAQRKVARRQNKKSQRRRKAILLLQKAHAHVANQRKDFQHQESYKLVRDFGTIVVEDLNIKGLSGGLLSKAVHDVGWSSFINMLSYKAENAGRQLLKVDPQYTSQECPNCHAIEKKQLSERVHRCDCGLTIHRDQAAAMVILGRGLRLQAETKPEVRVSVA
jgi:putative transposase